ncbi:MAG TPA: hypothetical protein VEI83_09300 [Acidimicrobiales bacterium]|nr:hypothetical protein [Acidimicrobiales bacterium]
MPDGRRGTLVAGADTGAPGDRPRDRMGELSPTFTANRAVDAIPAVCAAAPGIRTSVELPPIVPVLGG